MCRIAELSSKAGQLLAATVLALTGACLVSSCSPLSCAASIFAFAAEDVSRTTYRHALTHAHVTVLFNTVTTAGPVSASDMPAAVEEVAPAVAAPAAKKKIPET